MKNFIIILLLSLVLLFSCFNPMIDTEDNSPNVFVHVSGLSEGYRLGIEAYDSFGIVNVSSGEDFYLDKGECDEKRNINQGMGTEI